MIQIISVDPLELEASVRWTGLYQLLSLHKHHQKQQNQTYVGELLEHLQLGFNGQ